MHSACQAGKKNCAFPFVHAVILHRAGWIGNGGSSPWTNPTNTVLYMVRHVTKSTRSQQRVNYIWERVLPMFIYVPSFD